MSMNKATLEEVKEFWKSIVCNADGTLNADHVWKELWDFYVVLHEVPKVYCHITGNRLSKPLYDADVVCEAADAHYESLYEDEKADAVLRELEK